MINQHWEKFTSAALIADVEKWIFGSSYAVWKGRTVMFSWDAIFIAAGAITGLRVCTSMLISATLCWAVFVPGSKPEATCRWPEDFATRCNGHFGEARHAW